MNAKKRKEKELKRGLMTNAERFAIWEEKKEEKQKRIQGSKYKKPIHKK